MKKKVICLFLNCLIFCFLCSMAQSPESDPMSNGVGILTILSIIFLLILLVGGIILQIVIGKLIANKVTKSTGLVLGILFIVLLPFLIMGIAIIVYSDKKKNNNSINNQKINKFIGKNYKDILQENNLVEYINKFTENKLIDIEIISDLNDSDLEKIGINNLGDRKKILKIFSID